MMGRSMLAYIPVNLANLVVSFGTIVVLTRLLGSEEFGRYALAVITMHLVHMMLFTWLEAAMARFQARAERNGDVSSHLKTIYAYALGTAIIGFSLIIAILFIAPIPMHMRNLLLFVMQQRPCKYSSILVWKPIKRRTVLSAIALHIQPIR